MTEQLWRDVDAFIDDTVVGQDGALQSAVDAQEEGGLPAIQVSASQGKLLHLIARARQARTVLEVGTLGGYSTIWLARALPPGGRMVSLELDPHHAEVARANLERAGVSGVVEVRVGPALDSLRAMVEAEEGPFDVVFIDADKPPTSEYFRLALELSAPGSLIIVDNVVREGTVLHGGDEAAAAMRAFLEMLGRESRVSATVVQTVGVKGHDGFALALVGAGGG